MIYIPILWNKEFKKLIWILKLICLSLNLALVQGCDASVLFGLLKELIPIVSLFLKVSTKVFNLSLPLSFFSLSLWLCNYGKLWVLSIQVVHSIFFFMIRLRLVTDFSKNALDTVGDNEKKWKSWNIILGKYYEIKLGMLVSS